MNEPTQEITEREKEALKFLEQDFSQCFQQMRFYDSQIFETLKFLASAYSILIGVSVGLYQFGISKDIDLTNPVILVLFIGFVFGIFMFIIVVRNRVYYVQVARYVNYQRYFFLRLNPMGFQNKSKMYTDYTKPPYFNWRSSQTCLYFMVAIFNSIQIGILLHFGFPGRKELVILSSLLVFIIQLALAISYLQSRENKSACEAVFGKTESHE
jgi:hypothetical protein